MDNHNFSTFLNVSNIIANLTVIWLFCKNYLESKIDNRLSSFQVKDELEKHRIGLLNKTIKTNKIIIKDVLTNEELGKTEFADTSEDMVQIVTGLEHIKKSEGNKKYKKVSDNEGGILASVIGCIPYTNTIKFDINPDNERGTYILWCKFNSFSEFSGRNPYEKISYCKMIPRSDNAEQYGYYYDEIADFKEINNFFIRAKNRFRNLLNSILELVGISSAH